METPHDAPCPACGGPRLLVGCNTATLAISPFSALPLQALACANCGHTTLYALDVEPLRKLLAKQQGQGR